MEISKSQVSTLLVRTVDGLRVAVAGLAPDMPVDAEQGAVEATTVRDLRALTRLAQPLRVSIPYRLMPDSRVHVQVADPQDD